MEIEERMGLLISRYIDNEVSPEERALVEDHCKVCTPCRDSLEIFRKNEQILHSTLCGEIFDSMVIENVMRKVSRKQNGKRKSNSILKPAVAIIGFAASVIVVTVASYLSALSNTLHYELRKIHQQNEELLKEREAVYVEFNELRKKETASKVKDYLADGSGEKIAAYFEGNSVVIQAKFNDHNSIHKYNVFRRKAGETLWEGPINSSLLLKPEYVDIITTSGSEYEYEFRAFDIKNQLIAKSPVISVKHPDRKIKEEECFKIVCTYVSPDNRSARFLISRFVDGKQRTSTFECFVGSELGTRISDYQSQAMLDFGTGLVLMSIEDANQDIKIKPVVRKDNTTETWPNIGVIQSPSKKLTLKQKTGDSQVELWKYGYIFVPIGK